MLVSGWKWLSGIKDGPLPSPAALRIVSACEENPDRKKTVTTERDWKFILIRIFNKRKCFLES